MLILIYNLQLIASCSSVCQDNATSANGEPCFDLSMFKYNKNINGIAASRNFFLECYVRNKGPNVRVAWLYDDQIVSVDDLLFKANTNIEIDTDKENKFNLKFNDLEISQKGTYKCQITTKNASNLVYNLDVLYPPVITRTPNNKIISVKEGDSLSVHCYAQGNPKPKISWPSKMVNKLVLKALTVFQAT